MTTNQRVADVLESIEIVRRANAYPRLVEAVKSLLPDAKEPWGMRASALLRDLGETS